MIELVVKVHAVARRCTTTLENIYKVIIILLSNARGKFRQQVKLSADKLFFLPTMLSRGSLSTHTHTHTIHLNV